MTPETISPQETIEEIAERITAEVAKICGCAWESCTRTRSETQAAILSALRNERERCWREVTAKADEWRKQARQPNAKKNTLNQMAHGAAIAANVLKEGK